VRAWQWALVIMVFAIGIALAARDTDSYLGAWVSGACTSDHPPPICTHRAGLGIGRWLTR
jgi:hypothetical protein